MSEYAIDAFHHPGYCRFFTNYSHVVVILQQELMFVIARKPSLSKGGTARSRATLYNCNMLPEPDIAKCNTSSKRQKNSGIIL